MNSPLRALAPLLLCLCACGAAGRPAASSVPMTPADLQYRLVDTVGAPFYCDPTRGPVVRGEDPTLVAHQVAALRAQNPNEFDTILRHEHLNPASLSPADQQRVLGQASMLSAVALTPEGSHYRFAYELAGPPTVEVAGTIGPTGAITVASRAPAPVRVCPL